MRPSIRGRSTKEQRDYSTRPQIHKLYRSSHRVVARGMRGCIYLIVKPLPQTLQQAMHETTPAYRSLDGVGSMSLASLDRDLPCLFVSRTGSLGYWCRGYSTRHRFRKLIRSSGVSGIDPFHDISRLHWGQSRSRLRVP